MNAAITAAIAFNVSMRSRHRGMEARYQEEKEAEERRQRAMRQLADVDLRDSQPSYR
ncbi:MAG: hypothetical protein ACAH83_07545 [Alphaproteobacteria bacterium]